MSYSQTERPFVNEGKKVNAMNTYAHFAKIKISGTLVRYFILVFLIGMGGIGLSQPGVSITLTSAVDLSNNVGFARFDVDHNQPILNAGYTSFEICNTSGATNEKLATSGLANFSNTSWSSGSIGGNTNSKPAFEQISKTIAT